MTNETYEIIREPDPAQPRSASAYFPPDCASVVAVDFPPLGITRTYYNDRFDLKPGDIVLVEGSAAAEMGRVSAVSRHFKIRLSDYQRITAVVDSGISGKFYPAGTHQISFAPAALPAHRAAAWFFPAVSPDDCYISSYDGASFPLDQLEDMPIAPEAARRGETLFRDGRVAYLCMNASRGYAIVMGDAPNEVEVEFLDGAVRDLTCSCHGVGHCAHAYAALLQLRDCLSAIQAEHALEYADEWYFIAVSRDLYAKLTAGGAPADPAKA